MLTDPSISLSLVRSFQAYVQTNHMWSDPASMIVILSLRDHFAVLVPILTYSLLKFVDLYRVRLHRVVKVLCC